MHYQSEEIHTISGEEEQKLRRITFTFDPRENEMVRTKDGAYIIRAKRGPTLVNPE